jgi:hypothetical protein
MEAFLVQARFIRTSKQMSLLVERALKTPSLYFFADLLDEPSVTTLLPAEDSATLRLFCYGTYGEYRLLPSAAPIDDIALGKLKVLSLVSLAAAASVLPYASLQNELGLNSAAEVETLIVQAMNAGLVTVRTRCTYYLSSLCTNAYANANANR